MPRIEKMARQKDKTAEMEMRILSRIKEALENGDPVRSLDFNEEDQRYVNQAQLQRLRKCYILPMLEKTRLVMKITIK